MKDYNYVVFGVHDTTWEPLIKAVAERDNSHPDIIRKQAAQQQQALSAPQIPGVAINPQMVVAANPRAVRQANRALDAQQRGEAVRGGSTNVGDLYGAGFKGRAALQAGKNIFGAPLGLTQGGRDAYKKVGQGIANVGRAIGNTGIGGRMKNFMSNVKHTPGALMDAAKQGIQNREQRGRRDALEQAQGNYQQELQRLQGRYGGDDPLSASQLSSAIEDLNQRYQDRAGVTPQKIKGKDETLQEAMSREVGEIGNQLSQPRGFREALRARKNPQQPAAEEEPAAEEQPLPPGPDKEIEEGANTDAPMKEEEEVPFGYEGTAETSSPPMTTTKPTNQIATATEPPIDDELQYYLDNIASQYQEGETPYGSKDRQRQMARIARGGEFENFPSTRQGQDALKVLERMGYTPTQAKQIVQEAEGGNPQAKEIVEEAQKGKGKDDGTIFGREDVLELSQDKHTAAWDSLLKGLNIR